MYNDKSYVSEPASYPKFYPNISVDVYAPEWYYKGYHNHDHSWKILMSKHEDNSSYFIPKLIELIDRLKFEGKIKKVDLITIIPSSNLKYHDSLISTAKSLAMHLSTKYEPIIERIRAGRRNISGNSAQDRYYQTLNSMKLIRNLSYKEKDIMILDDVKTTGITILECIRMLMNAGAVNFHPICFGISKNLYRGDSIKWQI